MLDARMINQPVTVGLRFQPGNDISNRMPQQPRDHDDSMEGSRDQLPE